jgi:hypothetical protein
MRVRDWFMIYVLIALAVGVPLAWHINDTRVVPDPACIERRDSLRESLFEATVDFNDRRINRDSLIARAWEYIEICPCKGEE